VTPRENTDYTARYDGGADLPSSSSPVEVEVSPVVRAFGSDESVKRGETVQVAGVVAPADAVDQVVLQLGGRDGRPGWTTVATAPVGVDGEYAARWAPDRKQQKGSYLLRVVTDPMARFASGGSEELPLRIR